MMIYREYRKLIDQDAIQKLIRANQEQKEIAEYRHD